MLYFRQKANIWFCSQSKSFIESGNTQTNGAVKCTYRSSLAKLFLKTIRTAMRGAKLIENHIRFSDFGFRFLIRKSITNAQTGLSSRPRCLIDTLALISRQIHCRTWWSAAKLPTWRGRLPLALNISSKPTSQVACLCDSQSTKVVSFVLKVLGLTGCRLFTFPLLQLKLLTKKKKK